MRYLVKILVFMLLCSHNASAADKQLSVFVSIAPFKFIVDRIGGNAIASTTFIDAGGSPHGFSPSPRKMASLTSADVFFRTGTPSEQAWVDKLQRNYADLPIVNLQRGLSLIKMSAHHHDDEHDHDARSDDPHFWTSPVMMIKAAEKVTQTLVKLAPERAPAFNHRYSVLKQELETLDTDITESLKSVNNRAFMVFHPSWGYFAERYNLEQIPVEIEGKTPGARSLIKLMSIAKDENIKVIFVQPQINPSNISVLAKQLNAQVVTIDPLSYNYIENLKRVTSAFLSAKS